MNKTVNHTKTYVAFLRGINVGGHHKVPMAELRKTMETMHFSNVQTLLNSGNIIFDTNSDDIEDLENTISNHLEETFGFPIPTLLRTSETLLKLIAKAPFKGIQITKDIRLYVSFLREDLDIDLEIPWISDDGSFKILNKDNKAIISVLDLSVSKTPKAMSALEKLYGKDITTRNWKTIERINKKLSTH